MKSSFSSLMMIPMGFGFEMDEGVGIIMMSCCGPKDVWNMSLCGSGW